MRNLGLSILFLFSLILVSCSSPEENAKSHVLRISIQSNEFETTNISRYTPFLNYLSRELNLPYELIFPKTQEQLLEDIGKGKIDLAFLNGFSFVKSHILHNTIPLVIGNEDAKRKSAFLVRNSSPLKSFDDIKGKRISFISQDSTSGHLMARYFLEIREIYPDTDTTVLFSDSHLTALEWLTDNKIDVAVIEPDALRKLERTGEYRNFKSSDFRVLWETPSFPGYVWAMSPATPTELRNALAKVFLSLDSEKTQHNSALASLKQTGFIPANISDFEALSMVTNKVGLLDKAPSIYTLKFGVEPYLAVSDIYVRFSPFVDYLSRELNRPVKLEIAKDYKEFIDNMGNDRYDIAYMNPFSYKILVRQYGEKPLLGKARKVNVSSQRGVVIVKKDGGIASLSDLKGKSFAYETPASTTGYALAASLLCSKGMTMKDFGSYKFLSNQSNIAMGVLIGKFDAGAVSEETYRQYQARGLDAIATTQEVAGDVLLASSRLSPELRIDIRKAVAFANEHKDVGFIYQMISENITGFAWAEEWDFDKAGELLKVLESCNPEIKALP